MKRLYKYVLQLSWWPNSIKSSQAASHVSCGQKLNISKMISKTLGFSAQLTELVTQEDFMDLCESQFWDEFGQILANSD
jgi:hypothetical protein